ncbi:restriction endonuclease subunit S [Microbulbifer thermotolerans]|uniref:restriction endonuclease subunit S n=1 Tax=Microbulbifer thermotolerans TaxID=252514 RepID=UPI00224B93ED|nr:restriction endonuclease subunit S [Microbulbifer thermotolerans]MCX2843050.1 restriction endonuclease subunit S [Microbulbifer thermotolerans]
MVPEGWSNEPLSSVTSIIDCKHRTPVYVETGIPLVSPGTIKWGVLDLVSPVKRVSKEEYETLMDHCTVEIGDLVMSRNQSVGIASYVESNEPFVLGQDTILIKPIKVNSKFVFYKLQSEAVQRSIIKLAGGSTFSRINLGDIRKLNLDLPPLPEQKKIAKILSTWDKAITTTEQLLANSQQQKKALMQQLLTGKKRLRDKNGVRFSGEWKHGHLSDVGKITKGKALSSKDLIDGDYPVVAGGKSSPYSHKDFTHENVITVSASGAYAGYVAYHPYKLWASDCSVILAKENADISFIYQLMSHMQTKIYSLQSGGAQPHVYPKDLEVLRVNIPSIEEQQKIAAVLSAADKEIEIIQQQLDQLKQEKKALMQQLLTGKRRVLV